MFLQRAESARKLKTILNMGIGGNFTDAAKWLSEIVIVRNIARGSDVVHSGELRIGSGSDLLRVRFRTRTHKSGSPLV